MQPVPVYMVLHNTYVYIMLLFQFLCLWYTYVTYNFTGKVQVHNVYSLRRIILCPSIMCKSLQYVRVLFCFFMLVVLYLYKLYVVRGKVSTTLLNMQQYNARMTFHITCNRYISVTHTHAQ